MADAFSLAGDTSVTSQDFELAPLSVGGSAIVPSHPRRQPKTQNVSPTGKPRWSSQPTHQRFCVTLGEHPLSTVLDAPLFRDLSVSELKEISDAGQERTFSHNESLFGEGDTLRWV